VVIINSDYCCYDVCIWALIVALFHHYSSQCKTSAKVIRLQTQSYFYLLTNSLIERSYLPAALPDYQHISADWHCLVLAAVGSGSDFSSGTRD